VKTSEFDSVVLTYGATFVWRRILRFLRSCASGRRCRCFSREFRRSMGEMGLSSGLRTGVSLSVTAEDIFARLWECQRCIVPEFFRSRRVECS
jgi:hypothetical protein